MGWKTNTDALRNAVGLLVAVRGFVVQPGVLTGIQSTISIYDAVRKMASKAPPSLANLTDELTESARDYFDKFVDLSDDAEVLYEQMVIASLPDPKTLVAGAMDADTITEGMIEKLTDREHLRPPMPDVFRDLTSSILKSILADKNIAHELTPAYMAEVLRALQEQARILRDLEARHGSLGAALIDLRHARRDQLEAIAGRFGISPTGSEEEIRAELNLIAQEYHSLKSQIEAISPAMGELANIKEAAQAALERVDLEEVERLLLMVQTKELEVAAKTAELRADNALLRGRAHDAFHILSAAADSFAAVDPLEPGLRRMRYQKRLFLHGCKFVDETLHLSGEMSRAAANIFPREKYPFEWASAHVDLGQALTEQAPRVGGAKGYVLISEALDVFRRALTVFAKETQPIHWAMTQACLGNALTTSVRWSRKSGRMIQLSAAIGAFRSALTVFTYQSHPEHWALAQSNLGNSLTDLGGLTPGQAGDEHLRDAVKAHEAAMTVYTKETSPLDWAGRQHNLAITLKDFGMRIIGEESQEVLTAAREAGLAALKHRSREGQPMEWATTHEALALVEKAFSEHISTKNRGPHVEQGLLHVEAALDVYDLESTRHRCLAVSRLRDEFRNDLSG